MPPSIKDVARQSGVSFRTVSRVLNGEGGASPATQERIRAAATALNYRPDQSARSLRRGRTNALRLLIAARGERFLMEPFVDEVVTGIVDGAARAGYALLLEVAGRPGSDPPTALERRADATILMDARADSPLLPLLLQADQPFVKLLDRQDGVECGWVYADFRGGAERAVGHLLGLGHRRIAHLTGQSRVWPETPAERDRLVGYERALAGAGIAADPALVVAAGHRREHGFAAMAALLASGVDVTAVFAVNDMTALGAADCLRERGIRIPDDVSLAGFDDAYLAQEATPPLTTVRLPSYEIGVAAAELAIGAVEGRRALPAGREFPTDLVVRASTGAPPGDGERRTTGGAAASAAPR
jgi:LacI family transcriptional regulator